MADQFVAEIRILPYAFAPKGWASCDGQVMPTSQNTALFSILGYRYGGSGTTFLLPNLRERVAVGGGDDGYGNQYDVGNKGGAATVALTTDELPAHTHKFQYSERPATERQPNMKVFAEGKGIAMYDDATKPPTNMSSHMIPTAGEGKEHNNLMPFCTVQYCIALQGVFPNRS
jgi:microcystin-dependent protein